MESGQSLNYELDSILDYLCYMCLAGIEVASWSLTEEVTGSNNLFKKYFLSLNSSTSVKTFGENPIGPSHNTHHTDGAFSTKVF